MNALKAALGFGFPGVRMGRFLFAFLAAFAAWSVEASSWRCDDHARIEGNLLVVEVPPGAKGGGATQTIDLSRFPKGVELRIRCRGENVTRPEKSWLGSRFMLHFKDGSGKDRWPHARQRSGTFDWCELRFFRNFDRGVKDGTGELTLGLQEATGKIVFDLATLSITERQDPWVVPAADAGEVSRPIESLGQGVSASGTGGGSEVPAGAWRENLPRRVLGVCVGGRRRGISSRLHRALRGVWLGLVVPRFPRGTVLGRGA